ncbi:MAG TPA: tail fiber protein [Blastocatellia bacterium]|nr:tail fiber protein [Blastocatellia bacterium]
MSDPFVAEIRMFGFNFAPKGWALCNGQLLPISQNTALFSLLGTTYGGDGKSTFGLPNLQGNVPLHQGQGAGLSDRFLGETGGSSNVTLIGTELPLHSHTVNCNSVAGSLPNPQNNLWSPLPGRTPANLYFTTPANTTMSPQAIGVSGGSQPHNNMSPYLVVNFCIAMQGVFPARN